MVTAFHVKTSGATDACMMKMVIARFASCPLAANANLDPLSLPAYRAIADHLSGVVR